MHVSRDNGKTWKNVTPKGLVGARIQNIEDSPHARGRAYVAAYRFMREHDLKPYIYRTDDYGATWTLLTDGTNGIPVDYPTRVVREDPKQSGLLYAGTEFGAFVSFDAGKHWQTLQRNLPVTPVTDIRVHRNDLVISTMGRSAWIMDNVTPLQQLASLVSGTPRPADTAPARGRRGSGPAADEAQAPASGSVPPVYLFAPREAMRMRNSALPASPDGPEYPAGAAHIDVFFASAPPADTKVEITDARGEVIRTFPLLAASGSGAGAGQEMRGGFRRGGGSSAGIRAEAGLQRLTWDMRYPGPWAPNAPNGGPGGPMVPPGRYTVKMTAGGDTTTRTLDIRSDPRIAADGVTDADLGEQVRFQLSVRDAVSDARKLQADIEAAMQKAGVKPVGPQMAGMSPATTKYDHPLQQMWAQVATSPGIYTQGMLVDQLGNVQRMVSQADQKVGKDAYDRFGDLQAELARLQAAFKKLAQ